MHLIEPCCAQKHLSELRCILKENGTAEIGGRGDLSLNELMPELVNHYNGVRMLIAAPSLPDQAAGIIGRCMSKEWELMDGSGKIPVITHLTVVADLSSRKSPKASQWLKENPWGERLTLVDKEQEDTVILLTDFAITGPVNMRYGNPFTATATARPEDIAALWERYGRREEPQAEEDRKPAEAAEIPGPRRRNGRRAAV